MMPSLMSKRESGMKRNTDKKEFAGSMDGISGL